MGESNSQVVKYHGGLEVRCVFRFRQSLFIIACRGLATEMVVLYTYDADDRLITEVGTVINGIATTSQYIYGGSGNPASEVTERDRYQQGTLIAQSLYTYDVEGRLASFVEDRTEGTQHVHVTGSQLSDDGGTRVQESETVTIGIGAPVTTTTDFLLASQNPTEQAQVLEERAGANALPSRTYTIGLSVLDQADNSTGGGNSLFLLADGHGSIRLVVNTSQAIQVQYDYGAFGEGVNFI